MTSVVDRPRPIPSEAAAGAPSDVLGLLRGSRRRLRWAHGLARLQHWGPAIAAVALGLVMVGRVTPWAWPEPAAALVAVVGLAVIIADAVRTRITLHDAATAADGRLDTQDAFAACLEFGGGPAPFAEPVTDRARHLANGRSPRDAIALPWSTPRLAVLVIAGAVAVGLALTPNAQDDVRREQVEETRSVEQAAQELREQAEALRARPDAGEAERTLADELDAVARELLRDPSTVEARRLLGEAEAALSRAAPEPGMKAATLGLERALSQQPLTAQSRGAASEQLETAARELDTLTPAQQSQLADRLDALAQSQAAGNPALADDLGRAADALRAGDRSTAAQALQEAAGAQRSAGATVRNGELRGDAAASVRGARERLDGSRSATSSKSGTGQGTGSAEAGRQGEGKGEGNGQGQGQGEGKSQGQGRGQSQSGGRGGRGAGTGAPGDPGFEVYVPPSAASEQVKADGQGGGGDPGREVGRSAGGNRETDARQDLRTLPLDEYRDQATAAAERAAIPPSQRELVKNYFDQLDANLGGAP